MRKKQSATDKQIKEEFQKWLASLYLASYVQTTLEPFVERGISRIETRLEKTLDKLAEYAEKAV